MGAGSWGTTFAQVLCDAGTPATLCCRREPLVDAINGHPAAGGVACPDEEATGRLQQACHTGYFRPYTNPDVIGCELGGVVKNVIAIAVGIAAGMGLGDNTRAMLITRGLAEIARLGAV